jgi:predicted alpha-1,2-mannosidase
MRYLSALLIVSILACSPGKRDFDPASYVNPFIGTGKVQNHIDGGNTYPGAVRPWGMVSMSPHNIDFQNQVASTTYQKGNPYIYGFGHTHISGMGCNASGAILLKATTGDLDVTVEGTRSEYSNEQAIPGYYGVNLDRFGIQAGFTTTERTGLSRFRFPAGRANLMIDLGLTPDFGKSGKLVLTSDSTFEGFKREGNTCDCKKYGNVHFYGVISKSSKSKGFFRNYVLADTPEYSIEGDYVGAWFGFEMAADETIEVRVGVSYVSIDNARINLMAESGGTTFEQMRADSYDRWKTELGKIAVEGEIEENKVKFYSALYHALLHPNIFSDVNGEYRMHNSEATGYSEEVRYTNFSMWDTYRTLHPLLSLVYPERQEAMTASVIQMYEEGGWLPRIEVLGNNTGVMVGDPASIIINDTYQRGITGI